MGMRSGPQISNPSWGPGDSTNLGAFPWCNTGGSMFNFISSNIPASGLHNQLRMVIASHTTYRLLAGRMHVSTHRLHIMHAGTPHAPRSRVRTMYC